MPTCFGFGSPNPPIMHQKWNLGGIDFWFDFCIDFLSMFLRFGTSTWSYVGPQDASKTPPRRLPRRVRDNTFPDTFPDTKLVDVWSMFLGFWGPTCFQTRFQSSRFQSSCFIIFCSSAVADSQLCCALDKI